MLTGDESGVFEARHYLQGRLYLRADGGGKLGKTDYMFVHEYSLPEDGGGISGGGVGGIIDVVVAGVVVIAEIEN